MFRTLVIPRNTIFSPRYPLRCKTLIFSEIRNNVRLPVDAFISAENLVFHECEREFVYSALSPDRYDNLKNIYLNSHPRYMDLFTRFGKFKEDGGKVFLHEKYSSFDPVKTTQLLTEEEYQKFYLAFLKESN